MRPLELTLEGFRSYRRPVTFDLRDRRLVGIVGPIGAGKSSILDAVAFALYGRTPGVAQNTKSLIHQLADQAHVALTFEVDGQVWKAVRAPKRKGQSGHQLVQLARDEPGAEVQERVTQEAQVNARIERLLGMDFATFCRSVLLAQNRFSEFLKATPTERDKVLKGVFGYERLDAAKVAAERRLDREDLALEAFARERETLEHARAQLDQTHVRAETAAARVRAFDDAAPRIDDHERARAEAEAAEADAAELIEALRSVGAMLPDGAEVDATLTAAAEARDAVEASKASLVEAEAARATADAELAAVHERLGDREQLRSFEKLVDRHESLARARAEAEEVRTEADASRMEANAEVQRRDDLASAAAEADSLADAALEEAAAATTAARDALDSALHAEMAHTLRGSLTTGEPCPVCAQSVSTLPRTGAAPKGVSTARKALAKREAAEARARRDKEEGAASVGAAQTAVSEARIRAAQATERAEAAAAALRTAEAELTAIKDQLTERLGDGEPQRLVHALEAQLDEAELAAKEAAGAVEIARRQLDLVRDRAEGATRDLAALTNTLAGVWGALGATRVVEADPDDARSAFVDAGSTIMTRLQGATDEGAAAEERRARATQDLTLEFAALDLPPEADFRAARGEAGATHAAAQEAIGQLQTQLARAGDLERDVLQAEQRRSLAKRLADDLKPSRFLAFLLEEERAELAELGSGLFETLTDGTYRFSADDSFDVVDLNAADRTRKAGSLSGGETFLASLALALALAEMVARGGGRLDAFFLDEGFGSLDPEHLDRAMDGIGRLVADDDRRLVVVVSHVAEMRSAIEDLIELDKDDRTGDTIVLRP